MSQQVFKVPVVLVVVSLFMAQRTIEWVIIPLSFG